MQQALNTTWDCIAIVIRGNLPPEEVHAATDEPSNGFGTREPLWVRIKEQLLMKLMITWRTVYIVGRVANGLADALGLACIACMLTALQGTAEYIFSSSESCSNLMHVCLTLLLLSTSTAA
jgi:hypothetical protein